MERSGGARPAGAGKLQWVEVGRGLAAFAVAYSHLSERPRWQSWASWIDPVQGGLWGVEYFFVLSGFIIFYAHRRDLSRPETLRHYAVRRIARVIPVYWLVLLAALAFNQTFQNPAYRVGLSAPYLIAQILLLPGGEPLVGVAWTLRHELLFYAVFALCLWSVRIGAAAFALWMIAVAVNWVWHGPAPGHAYDAAGILLLHYNLDFLIGVTGAIAHARGRIGRWTAGMAVLTAMLALSVFLTHDALSAHLLLWKGIFGLLLGLAVIASVRALPAPRFLVGLGAISYALYLVHLLIAPRVFALFRVLLHVPSASPIALWANLAIIVVVATLLHRCFEKPVMAYIQGLRIARRPEARA